MRTPLPLFLFALAAAAPAVATEPVAVSPFRSVQLRGGGNIVVVPGPTQRVTIVEGSRQFTDFTVDRNGRLRIDACNRRCPRNYRLRIQIQSPRVPDLAIHGGGAITAQGGFRQQSQLSVAIHGGGKIDSRAVEASSVSAAVNGGGEVLVRSRSNLSAAVNGGGLVRFWGNPRVSSAVHGGGLVKPGG